MERSMRPRSRTDNKGMSQKVTEPTTKSPDGLTIAERNKRERAAKKAKKPVAMMSGGKMPKKMNKGGKNAPNTSMADAVEAPSPGIKPARKGPSTKMYRDKRDEKDLADILAARDKFKDRGKSGEGARDKRYAEIGREYRKNEALLEEYGKDAPKARTFMTEKQPDKKSYGGKMTKKMNMGGGTGKCRGMGAATRGGNFKMG